MALFVGGPADGSRIEVAPGHKTLNVAVNEMPPAFTPDADVLQTRNVPTFTYKQQQVMCGNDVIDLYTPTDWDCSMVMHHLISGYGVDKRATRIEYLRRNEGTMYDNDDRVQAGRPYRI